MDDQIYLDLREAAEDVFKYFHFDMTEDEIGKIAILNIETGNGGGAFRRLRINPENKQNVVVALAKLRLILDETEPQAVAIKKRQAGAKVVKKDVG